MPVALVREWGAGEPVVICGHRENLPATLRWICESLGAPVPAGTALRKGAFRVLHVADGPAVAHAEGHIALLRGS